MITHMMLRNRAGASIRLWAVNCMSTEPGTCTDEQPFVILKQICTQMLFFLLLTFTD